MNIDGEEHFFVKKLNGVDDFESVFTNLTLTGNLTVEGTTNMEQTLDMGSAQIKDLGDGTLDKDAINLGQLNTQLGNYVLLNGDSAMARTTWNVSG